MLPTLLTALLALPAIVLGSPLTAAGSLVSRGNAWGQGHGSGKPDKGNGMPADISFVLVGDSTTNNGTTPNSGGWSRGFCGALDEGTFCSNRAANGRTTGTIVRDGFWALAMEDLKGEVAKGKTVFVTLQFGHNDQKIAPASSMAQNLTLFAEEIRQNGGYPVLVTALTRRGFSNTTNMVSDALADWAQGSSFLQRCRQLHRKAMS
jgi:lysophospholipase L1-like esterase